MVGRVSLGVRERPIVGDDGRLISVGIDVAFCCFVEFKGDGYRPHAKIPGDKVAMTTDEISGLPAPRDVKCFEKTRESRLIRGLREPSVTEMLGIDTGSKCFMRELRVSRRQHDGDHNRRL
jgi:hypothetical protein